MAKLSAYGRREVARIEKEAATPTSDLISWERLQYAIMHTGAVLSRRSVRFLSDDRYYDYGWKATKFKVPPAKLERFLLKAKEEGWTQLPNK